jgi:CRP-like cAMP-binding protein
MGHYADIPASASVVAETQSLVLFVSVEGMRRMESEDGNTAIAFHREIARQLSERLLATVRAMEAHLD